MKPWTSRTSRTFWTRWTLWTLSTLLMTLSLSSPARGQAAAAIDAAFTKFWEARTPAGAARAADAGLAAGAGYEDALRRLRDGRPYASQKPGVVMLTNKTE